MIKVNNKWHAVVKTDFENHCYWYEIDNCMFSMSFKIAETN